jgi:hypothetical protein
MIIAVTDANIFIDLIKLELLGFLFDLDVEVHTTYEVYYQLNDNQEKVAKNFVQSKALTLYSLTSDELGDLNDTDFPKGLEIADKTIYLYAVKTDGFVLSGDNKLRKFCEAKLQKVNGILWVFDQFHQKKLLTPNELANKLKILVQFNPRLPMEECNTRINRWSK